MSEDQPEAEDTEVTKSTHFSGENSESEFDILSEDDEVTLSFTDLLDDVSPDEIDGMVNCQTEGGRKGRSNSRLLHATDLLVAAFQLRLEHLALNVADYPPAVTFVKYVSSMHPHSQTTPPHTHTHTGYTLASCS